jgi:hypothetical protein
MEEHPMQIDDHGHAVVDHTHKVDARPALPISSSNESLWDKAVQRRDQIAVEIEAFFESRAITAWVRKSKPGEYPIYILVDSWLTSEQSDISATIDKSSLKISISVEPYHVEPFDYEVTLRGHGKVYQANYWQLETAELKEIFSFLLDGGNRPEFFRDRVPAIARILGGFIPFVGHTPENKLVKEARPNYFTIPVAILAVGAAVFIAVIAFGSPDSQSVTYWWAGFIILACSIVAYSIASRRPVLEVIPKQSMRCPRQEFLIDSWHVSVPGAGRNFPEFKERILRVVSPTDPSIECNTEIHQNSTPRGFEERERTVLSKGQATLHVHIYQYGVDAFVGWDSNLNWQRWAEGATVASTVREKHRVDYKALVVGWHRPTDFDLMELNVLTETTHQRVVDEIRLFLKEKEIEADLDFKIIRGDRGKALEERKNNESGKRVK